MTIRVRRVVFLIGVGLLAVMLARSVGALPHFGAYRGPYGDVVSRASVSERHITDVVTAVNFDFRGFDTLGEEFIFFAAVLGVALILRPQTDEGVGHVIDCATGRAVPPTSDAVRVLGLGLTPPTVLFGIYVVVHGHLTPGGGFQGGVILATGVLLIYLAGEFDDLHGLYSDSALERAEAVGAAGFIGLGLLGVIAGSVFLDNVLPLGRTGSVFSAGMVPLINLSVGLEIAAGLVLLLTTFLRQTIVLRRIESPARRP
ncbi:MAG TPA: MnhB domain-containing protein [Acidimicrobiia bacterium]|nr:MnhB domain-containing protein [Acidimicrobiia bacterium]